MNLQRISFLLAIGILTAPLLNLAARGDVTNVVVDAQVEAFLENFPTDNDSASSSSGNLSASVVGTGNGSTSNSSTSTSLNYSWDGTTLVGNALVTEAKDQNAKSGGLHEGLGNLCFSFTVDTDTMFSLDGSFGYVGPINIEDDVEWRLESTDGGGFLQFKDATSTTSVNGDSFSDNPPTPVTGVLSPGDYKLTLKADFHETINNLDTRQAGWTLDEFTLVAVAVPEPASCTLIFLTTVPYLLRRNRCQNRD